MNKAQVLEAIEDIVKANPNRKNPRLIEPGDDPQCVYTSPNNPNLHCIAGQLATKKNWALPSVDESANSQATVHHLYNEQWAGWDELDSDAAELLSSIQGRFDMDCERDMTWQESWASYKAMYADTFEAYAPHLIEGD